MKLFSVLNSFLASLIYYGAFLLISCNKIDQPQINITNNDFGIMYYAKNGTLTAYDLNKNTFLWKAGKTFAWDYNGIRYENGIIYTGNVYGIAATDAKTGAIKWQTSLSYINYHQGSFSSENNPVIKDSLIYIISYADDGGSLDHPTLNCVNKSDGKIKWRKDLTPGSFTTEWIYTTPVIVNDKIIALSHTSQPSEGVNIIFCFNRITGQKIWENRIIADRLFSYPCAPDTTQVVFQSVKSGIFYLDINNGNIKKNTNVLPEKLVGTFNPYIYNNELLLFAGFPGHILKIDKNSGSLNKIFPDSLTGLTFISDKAIVQHYTRVISCRDLTSYGKSWTWIPPAKKLYDSLSQNTSISFQNSFYSSLVSDGKIVYYYENLFDNRNQLNNIAINSIFMLNAETGILEKEIKVAGIHSDSLLSKNFIIVKNNQAYSSPLNSFQ